MLTVMAGAIPVFDSEQCATYYLYVIGPAYSGRAQGAAERSTM